MTAYLAINGVAALSVRATVPYSGRWFVDVDVDLEAKAVPTGSAVVVIGETTLRGTIASEWSNAWIGRVRVRVVAGANGWSRSVAARSYHDDGGVRRVEVLEALARDTGETIDTASDGQRMAIDFARPAGTASRTLELVAPGWRVDFDGVTRYGARTSPALPKGAQLLEAEAGGRVLTFAADDLSALPLGVRVEDGRLSVPVVVREVRFEASPQQTRAMAWAVPA